MLMSEQGLGRRTVNAKQAQALASVSRRTLYYWIAQDKVECIGAAGSRRIYVDTLPRPRNTDASELSVAGNADHPGL